jgi:hypothetical protein
MAMDTTEIEQVLIPLVETFEKMGIAYHIGGSVASSSYGILRRTEDVDVVADLQFQHIQPLVKQLETVYYVNADAVRDAIRYRSSFNVIHYKTTSKVDIFIPKPRQFAQQERLRARPGMLAEGTRLFYISSPEDIILNKLEWYRMGDEVSTRQWKDILGILKRGKDLDLAYMQQWAVNLRVSDLLERALIEAGLKNQ